jgi:hypothetical protein
MARIHSRARAESAGERTFVVKGIRKDPATGAI